MKDKPTSTGFEGENYSNLSVENPFLVQLLNNCIFLCHKLFCCHQHNPFKIITEQDRIIESNFGGHQNVKTDKS